MDDACGDWGRAIGLSEKKKPGRFLRSGFEVVEWFDVGYDVGGGADVAQDEVHALICHGGLV